MGLIYTKVSMTINATCALGQFTEEEEEDEDGEKEEMENIVVWPFPVCE